MSAEHPTMDQRAGRWKIALALVAMTFAMRSADGQALTPPNFNLAVGRKVEATSTCGVGVTEPELYCKLTGANPDKEDVIGEFEVDPGPAVRLLRRARAESESPAGVRGRRHGEVVAESAAVQGTAVQRGQSHHQSRTGASKCFFYV